MLPTPPETVPLPEKRVFRSVTIQISRTGILSPKVSSKALRFDLLPGKFVHHTANAQIPHSKLDHHIAGGQLKLRHLKKYPALPETGPINRRVLVFFSRKIQGRSIKAPYSSRFPLRLWYWFPATKTFRIFFTGPDRHLRSGVKGRADHTEIDPSLIQGLDGLRRRGVGTMTLILGYRPWNRSRWGSR